MKKNSMTVLICENEGVLLAAMEFRLRKQQLEPIFTTTIEEATAKIEAEPPAIVVIDASVSQELSLAFIRKLRNELKYDAPIVFLADLKDDELILEGLNIGATDFIVKPFKPAELVLRIRAIFQATASVSTI